MTDPASQQLLAWAATRDERAFRAVVEHYAGLVHGVALRRTGNPDLAAEAAQAVFVKLAQKPRDAAAHPAAWLHRVAVHESQHVLRSEFRHRRRVQALADSMNTEPAHEPWSAVRDHLDEALDDLPAADRRVLMLRFFEGCTASQIGQAIGISAEAAQKRTVRALERLSGLLRRRGVAVPAAVLGTGLTSQLAEAAPAALVTQCAAAAASVAPASGFLTSSLAIMTTAKLTTTAVVALAAAIPVAWDVAASSRATSALVGPDLSDSSDRSDSSDPSDGSDPSDPSAIAAFIEALDRLANSGDDPPPGLELSLRRRIMEMDGAEIRALAAALPQRPNLAALYNIVACVYGRWFEVDEDGAKTALLARHEPYLKHAARHGLLATWGAADPQGALAWLGAHPDLNEHGFAMMNVFRGWAHRDPRAAADGALAVAEENRGAAVHAALQTWAATPQETQSAVGWVNAMIDDGLRHKASSTLVSAMRDWPMEVAISTSLLIEDAEARTEGIELPMRLTAIRDEEGAVRVAAAFRELPPERQDPGIAGRLVDSVALHSGLVIARAFLDELPESPAREEACERFAAIAAQQGNFAEAAPYAARLPLESGATRMDLFAAQWAMRDAAAAEAWVRSLPEGPHRRRAEEGLALATGLHNTRSR